MELNDVLKVIGMESVKDLDQFKEKFQGKFISKEDALSDDEIKGKITGKITGAFNTKFKKLFDLETSEIEGKKWEEILELGVTKQKNLISELEGKQGQSNDDALKDWQLKYEKALKTISDYKEQNETLSKGLEATEKTWSEKYTGLRKNNLLEGAKSKLQSKLRDLSDFEKLGFESIISKNIQIEFGENDEVVVKGADGKRIPNPNKIGSYLSLDEALENEAVKGNLIKKNNGGTPNPSVFQAPQQQQQQAPVNPGTPQRTIHPNALKNAEVLKAQAKG